MKRIGVTRIPIEEDAGKLLHDESFSGSLVDLNRCGVPLIEIVSEPDIRSSAEAKAYLDTIKSILQYLNISDCKMQEGSIRCDVNVSVREKGATEFGTRCEMKNVNSFSAAVRGIEYEAKRQIEILEAGGTIAQETRRWDDAKGMSILMRTKEDAQDYRYFPEPDLLTIVVPGRKDPGTERQHSGTAGTQAAALCSLTSDCLRQMPLCCRRHLPFPSCLSVRCTGQLQAEEHQQLDSGRHCEIHQRNRKDH